MVQNGSKWFKIKNTLKMMYNLLQKSYDLQCELFISGYINLTVFEQLEKEYYKRIKLFTINLN